MHSFSTACAKWAEPRALRAAPISKEIEVGLLSMEAVCPKPEGALRGWRVISCQIFLPHTASIPD
jgi:hypothetical protein